MSADPARVREIFGEAVLKDAAAERVAYLNDACRGDGPLRDRVESLLAAHDEAGEFFKLPDAAADSFGHSEVPGSMIGHYKLLEQIGEGGFGVVFMAEQQKPVHRLVGALKIIKLGMDTRQVVARFEAERQALAMMDHANIAKVFDAGATDTGRPYFVMELVKGTSITKYCDENKLDIRQRLELFSQVCIAVQHAHQKGIIHRDLKPSNVLVTRYDEQAVPKIIDFGVAKATQVKLTDKTLFTGFRQLIGTPTYMSPEQAQWSGLDIDTRTDIYSLGVLLYELLTGTTPFDSRQLMNAAYEEMQRIVREVEPPKPSTRISELKDTLPTVAEHRATEPRKLNAVMRGDLDWITMKALEKDRNRRYESASALAEDIVHYLSDEPVSAAAPSKFYRLRKFVNRNKLAVFAAGTVLATLLVGIIGTTIGLVGQSRQTAKAEAARDDLKAVNDFITEDLLGGADPSRLPDKAVRDQIVKVMLDPSAATVAQRFKDKPLVEASIRMALANAYAAVARHELAVEHARCALNIRRRHLGDDDQDTLISARFLAMTLGTLGRFGEAAPLFQGLLAGHRHAFGDDHEATILAITSDATQLQLQGNFRAAEPLCREALERSRRLGNDTESTIMSLNNFGYVLMQQGRLDEAEPLLREAMDRSRKVLGDSHRGTLRAIDNWATLLGDQGRLAEAEPVRRELLETSRRVLGDDDPWTLSVSNNMMGLLVEQGKFKLAVPMGRDSLERHQRVFGKNHPEALISLNNLGLSLRRQGKIDDAEKYSTEALERARRVLGDNHPTTLFAITNMGTLRMAQRRLGEAEPYVLEAFERSQKVLPENHPLIADAIFNLADLRHRQKRLDEARQLFVQALERRQRLLGAAHPYTNYALFSLGMVLFDQGEHQQSLVMFRQALANLSRVFGPEYSQVGIAHMYVGRSLSAQGQYSEAEPELIEADRILASTEESRPDRPQQLCEAFVELYEAWEKAEPDSDRVDKADNWRKKLAAATLPATKPLAKKEN